MALTLGGSTSWASELVILSRADASLGRTVGCRRDEVGCRRQPTTRLDNETLVMLVGRAAPRGENGAASAAARRVGEKYQKVALATLPAAPPPQGRTAPNRERRRGAATAHIPAVVAVVAVRAVVAAATYLLTHSHRCPGLPSSSPFLLPLPAPHSK